MVNWHRFVLALAFLPVGKASRKLAASNETLEENLGLRPVFEKLLGAKTVDNFIANAWTSSITEFDGEQHYNENIKPYTHARQKPEATYPLDNLRFDALGPVLQCPSSILSTFVNGDGEKHICGISANSFSDSASVTTRVNDEVSKPCVIISIGGKDQWDFELSISKAFPHCHIHKLDCTVDGSIPEALANQATFHKICIGTEKINAKMAGSRSAPLNNAHSHHMRWVDFAAVISLNDPPDLMRMDNEGHEWSILIDMAVNAPHNLLPQSISVVLHYDTRKSTLPSWNRRLRSPHEIGAWMDFMLTRGEYVLVDRNDNKISKDSSEISIVHIPS